MQKSAIKILGALLLMSACNKVVLEPQQMGSITLSLSSDVEIEAPTKAADDYDLYNVTISGEKAVGGGYEEKYSYAQIKEGVSIPYGTYRISAQNCTDEQAVEGMGQAHYLGTSDSFDVNSSAPVTVSVKCVMVNAKASLTLDKSFLHDFTDITASLEVGERIVSVPLDSNPAGGQEIYFNVPKEGADLIYRVTGKIGDNTLTYTNSASPMLLLPAKWANITIRSNHNGIIGPDISVDDGMDDDSQTEIIDPEGGVEVIEGDLSLPTIYVNTQIGEATVIDCEIFP